MLVHTLTDNDRPLDVVLAWHMHQPMYRCALTGRYRQPWVYLHAIKDYADMAHHLESTPGARAVVNFTPVLLEQLADYASQFERLQFRDPLLETLASGDLTAVDDRVAFASLLFRSNETRMIRRFPAYARLYDMFRQAGDAAGIAYLSDQWVLDALVWFHLAWLGESERVDERVVELVEKEVRFSGSDCRLLLSVIGDVVRGVVGRYRALADTGVIELTTTPYGHPILPLLISFESAREAQPDTPLPSIAPYPGGQRRAAAHVHDALRFHAATFGRTPAGCWPAEGAISAASLEVLAAHGVRFAASGQTVLANSLQAGGAGELPQAYPHRAYRYRTERGDVACFFRDERLSDAIGFEYNTWHADDAVSDLTERLGAIARDSAHLDAPVASIILDGENAWEYYPENGRYFIGALYRRLADDPRFRLTTFSEHLEREPIPQPLAKIVAGSWVYGTLNTWIGNAAKNRAWDLLSDAKLAFDESLGDGVGDDARASAEAQLKVCEASDWCWWFDEHNPALSVSDFDLLYRQHLRDLYALIGRPAPETLRDALSHGGAARPPAGGTMRPGRCLAWDAPRSATSTPVGPAET